MNSTTPQPTHARPPRSASPRPIAVRRRDSTSLDRPTWADALAETVPIVDAPAFFGPPVIFVMGPWLLLVLLLIGPFALILTVLLVVAIAAGLLTVLVAAVAAPYLLVRHLHAHGSVDAEPPTRVQLFRNQTSPHRDSQRELEAVRSASYE